MPGVPQIPTIAATQMASVRLNVRRLPQRFCRNPNPTAPTLAVRFVITNISIWLVGLQRITWSP